MEHDLVIAPQFRIDSPYLADYFGLWAIDEKPFRAAVDRCQGINLHAHLTSQEMRQAVEERDGRSFALTEDGIAIIAVRGPTMKAVPSLAEGTSTVRLRQQFRQARRDSQVRGAMLVMDTPGGTVKGNEDLAAEVANFSAAKPLYAFVEDLTASAGVSIASQARKRYANIPTAVYGSMGTYAVLTDLSGMAEQLGVKVHVIRAGDFKGLGEPGTEITEAQIAEIQRLVNRHNEAYLGLIAKGLNRSIESIRPLADGRVHLAADAVELGLLDGVQSYEETYRQLLQEIGGSRPFQRSASQMEKQPATLAELKATFKNSTAEWRETQLEAGASLSDAAIAYAAHVEAQAAAEKEQHKKQLDEAVAKAKTEAGAASSLGQRPLLAGDDAGGYQSASGDPSIDFDAAVRARLPKHGTATLQQRQAAIAYVARTQPELHQAMIATANPGKKAQRILAEKYEAVGAQ